MSTAERLQAVLGAVVLIIYFPELFSLHSPMKDLKLGRRTKRSLPGRGKLTMTKLGKVFSFQRLFFLSIS